jgi:hypothetical protein
MHYNREEKGRESFNIKGRERERFGKGGKKRFNVKEREKVMPEKERTSTPKRKREQWLKKE